MLFISKKVPIDVVQGLRKGYKVLTSIVSSAARNDDFILLDPFQLLHNNHLCWKEFYLTVYCGHLKNLTLLDIFVNNDTALRTARHTEQDDNSQRERKTALV